jgi:hypothetical protein
MTRSPALVRAAHIVDDSARDIEQLLDVPRERDEPQVA